ncbi:MAG: hypothetical protein ISR05_07540, partial [Burkholderiales bacterium]|nr:hypothetical protein [Burkholderiales bacterium]
IRGSRAVAAPRHSRTENKQTKEDSFFSKPYVAQSGISGAAKISEENNVNKPGRIEKKQTIAALFMPPAGEKKD